MPEQHQRQIFVEAPPLTVQTLAPTQLRVPAPLNGHRAMPFHNIDAGTEIFPAYNDNIEPDRSVDSRTQILSSLTYFAGTVLAISGDFAWRFNEFSNDVALRILYEIPAFDNITNFFYSRPYAKLIPPWEAKAVCYAGIVLISASLLTLSGSIIASKLSPKGIRNRK